MFIGDYYYLPPESFPQLSTSSIYFVVFAFIVFCLARPFKSILRPFVLLIANAIFLYSFSIYHLVAITIIAIISYLFGLVLSKYKKPIVLALSIIPFVLVLCYFKYANLFVETSLVMPLGLSFYSFKILSYLIDIYKGKVEVELNPIYYLDYVMFFPSVTAGPIHRSKEFFETLKNPKPFDYKDAKSGGFQMMLGIFEKMVFCDYIGIFVGKCLAPETTGITVLLGIVLYSFQIYLDFDSYSNIAIGLARVLGFHLPKNFNSPYVAKTLNEFWRRWHISLSSWLRDYIYIPLGGNRKGKIRRYINLTIVFLVSGIWHGSTWNFVIWGLLHAVVQIIEDLILKPFKGHKVNKVMNIVLSILGVIVNFIIVTFLWLIFKYQTMDQVFDVLNRMMIMSPFNYKELGFYINEMYWLLVVILSTIIFDVLRSKYDMLEKFNKLPFVVRWIVYALLVSIFLVFGVYGGSFDASDFIYQFF